MTNQIVARLLRNVISLLAAAQPSAQKTSDVVQFGSVFTQTLPQTSRQTRPRSPRTGRMPS